MSILKTFLNNKNCIPSIYHDNNYIRDFKEKAEIFNNFFAEQCTVNNTSELPTDSIKITNSCIPMISFTKDDIAKIMKNFDPNSS